ncbi:uncharacterized protein LOC126779442 isoform X4 [Nymphalis io]|uniref:uncharacterized protein LOC126779442 isoform X4 n=1 Tax=Inachis io TaxID=171585 RepID=UPI00216A3236|nr:uncharacterized protein LOC126779442 isoform X4 [Nymphalis io]
MSDNLKTLIKKRSSIKSKLTIFNNYLMLIKSSPELSELQRLDLMERFRKFENLYNEFDDLQNTIELLSEDAESTFTEREDFDRQYFNLVALTRSLLGASSNGTGSEAGFKDADSALVNVIGASGKKYTARLLLDNGSTANFVTQTFFEKLGLLRRGTSTRVTGLKLADPNFNVPSAVDILVGAEVFWEVLSKNYIDLGKNLPKLHETRFGWLVSGSIPHQSKQKSIFNHFCHHTNVTPDLTQFWELDNVSSKHSYSLEERACEQIFKQTTVRNNDGGFVVTMPLKGDPSNLGQSYLHAKNRFLSLERRFRRDPIFKRHYIEFMREYENLGHMTLDSHSTSVPEISKFQYFIPHHGVVRDSSTTTKLRVVFDASASTSSGVSLNDIQMVGPVVQDDLFSILTRFRQHRYVVSGDVEKMYRAIELNPVQRPLQKIIFRFNSSEPLKTYTLNTVTYGTASAPYLATKCLTSLADNLDDYRVQSAIRRDFYVDDYLSGGNTISETIEISKKVHSVLSSAKFNLRKWRSNNPEILRQVTNSKIESQNTLHFFDQDPNSCQAKTLGLNWVCDSDSLTYTINITPNTKITKRHVLSVISKIFDPLGLVGPYVVQAKIIMQRLWINKYDWDDEMSHELKNLWSTFENTLISLNNLKIPRWVLCQDSIKHEIHVFTDASEKAYGACLYIRSSSDNGSTNVQLLVSRNRIAPVKPTTIPRLELCGALLVPEGR